jgi:hypothetical protein
LAITQTLVVSLELFLSLVVVRKDPESQRVENDSQQPQMIRSFAASLIVALLLGASLIILPNFAKVEAREPAALAKGDRLEVRAAKVNCSTEVWPDLSSRCLQSSSGATIQEARLVTARR